MKAKTMTLIKNIHQRDGNTPELFFESDRCPDFAGGNALDTEASLCEIIGEIKDGVVKQLIKLADGGKVIEEK